MSERPTPETDAFFSRTDIDWNMEVDFARRLERERDGLKEQLDTAMMLIRLQKRRAQQTNEQP